MAEVLPGLHQIEQILGPRYLHQYLLLGERSLLIDTGLATSPDEHILPYFARIGFDPRNLDLIAISHADVDHNGGMARLREVAPRARFACHRRDAHLIADREHILKERYGWYERFGMGYPPDVRQWLRDALGADVRIDLQLSGGEIFLLGDNRPVHVLHLPGHSDGHLGFYDEANKAAVIIDAVLWRGLLDMDGAIISPPPYSLVEDYLATIDTVLALDFEHLFTGHYANKSGGAARQFLEESKRYVRRCHEVVADILCSSARTLTLAEVHQQVDQTLGPYPVMAIELARPVYAHLEGLVAEGRAARDTRDGQPVWRIT